MSAVTKLFHPFLPLIASANVKSFVRSSGAFDSFHRFTRGLLLKNEANHAEVKAVRERIREAKKET